MTTERLSLLKTTLLTAYNNTGLWGEVNPAWPLPNGCQRGSEAHLIYLTLLYTISGGRREPIALWTSARLTFETDPQLFDPHFLAYTKAADLIPRLQVHNLTQKTKSEATVWQRIGQALIMRAEGSVLKLLAAHNYQAKTLVGMLAQSKTTFPVLSGPQTGPRWLYGLANVGQQPISGLERLVVPVSPAATRALQSLSITTKTVSAMVFDPLDTLGRRGCSHRNPTQTLCPVAQVCPVAGFCQYGSHNKP